MANHEAVGVEELVELESHLLEDFDALCTDGHEAADAFDLAVGRLGACGTLHAEFAKRDRRGLERERALWALFGILAWIPLSKAWSLVVGKGSLLLAVTLPEGWRGGSWLYGEGGVSEGYGLALALVDLAFLYLVLRAIESPRSIPWLFRLRREIQHPIRFSMLVVAAIVVLGGVGLLVNIGLTRVYPPEAFGRAAGLSFSRSLVLALLLPLVLGSLVLRWRNVIRIDGDREDAREDRTARVPAAIFWMLLGVVGYSILRGVLGVVQILVNGAWIRLKPGPWPLESGIWGFGASELEIVLLVLLPLMALLLSMRALFRGRLRDRLHGVLRLMLRRRRFWAVLLLLWWLPAICLRGVLPLVWHWMSPESVRDFVLLNAQTNLLVSLALPLVIMLTFVMLVHRRGRVADGEVGCTR